MASLALPTTPPLTMADIQWTLSPLDGVTASHASCFEDIVEITIERDAYRLLSVQLLHHLHDVTLERDVLREQRRLDRQQNSARKMST